MSLGAPVFSQAGNVNKSVISVIKNLNFFHTFSVILIPSNYRKCMGKSNFSRN